MDGWGRERGKEREEIERQKGRRWGDERDC